MRERERKESIQINIINNLLHNYICPHTHQQMVEQRKVQQQRTIQQMPLQQVVNPHHSRMASYPTGTM